MPHNTFFSIIIPTYNRANFIAQTIQSVLKQTYPYFEIIVVDDGSTDHTEEVVTSIVDSRISYYNKENGERGAARNYGMCRAKGEYITFLDSDDILYENYLKNARESIQNYDFPLFLHIGYEVTDEELRSKTKVNSLKSDDISIFVKGNPLSCLGVFLHKSIITQFKFNEDKALAGSEDWELWLRLAANVGIKTDNRISAALIDHDHRSVVGYNEYKLVKRKELALKYAFEDPAVQEKFGPYLNKMIAYCDSYIALHLILSKQNKQGIRYLKNAFLRTPAFIFERRFAAIIKHLIINILF
jgi:glycosyltransferase involved in cell wall biosynthesis